jgi:hypothetical protein
MNAECEEPSKESEVALKAAEFNLDSFAGLVLRVDAIADRLCGSIHSPLAQTEAAPCGLALANRLHALNGRHNALLSDLVRHIERIETFI